MFWIYDIYIQMLVYSRVPGTLLLTSFILRDLCFVEMLPILEYYTQLVANNDSDILKEFEKKVNEIHAVRPSVYSLRSKFPFPSDLDLDKQAKYICGTVNLHILYSGFDFTPQDGNCEADKEVLGLENCDCSDPDTYDFYDEGTR